MLATYSSGQWVIATSPNLGNDRIRDKGRWSGYFGVETNAYELSRYAPAHQGSERERERERGGA